MEVPVPSPTGHSYQSHQSFEVATSAVVTNFLFKSFKFRIEQAMAGQRHGGPLSRGLLEELVDLRRRGETVPSHNQFKLADYGITRMREWSRILEPHERPDIYRQFVKNMDPVAKALSELEENHDPARLTEQIRKLYASTSNGGSIDVRLRVMRDALALAPRAGESLAEELLLLVPDLLAHEPEIGGLELPRSIAIRGELIQRALVLAESYERSEFVATLTESLIELVVRGQGESRLRLMGVSGAIAIRVMKQFGQRDAIDRFCMRIQQEVLGGESLEELREQHSSEPELWAADLISQIHVAGGWLALGRDERAFPTLEEARDELLSRQALKFQTKTYVILAQAYLAALGHGPAGPAFAHITELFHDMDPRRITNTYTTARFFSRFHLILVEGVIEVLSSPCEPTVRAHG